MLLRSTVILAFLTWSIAGFGQSKKEIIAAQAVSLDSIFRIAEEQHALILRATERIEELSKELDECKTTSEHARVSLNDRYEAMMLTYNKLKEEHDELYAQHRVVGKKLQRIGNDRQGYICLMPFSDRQFRDSLILEVAGPDLLGAVLTFRVIGHSGREIYRSPVELLSDEDLILDEKQQYDLLDARIMTFFQDQRFGYSVKNRTRSGESFSTSLFTFPASSFRNITIGYSSISKQVVVLEAEKQ